MLGAAERNEAFVDLGLRQVRWLDDVVDWDGEKRTRSVCGETVRFGGQAR